MSRIIKSFIATALLGAAGCTTHLEVGRAQPESPVSRQGIAYFLPLTQFATKATWTVTGCNEKGPDIAVKTEATSKAVKDPDHLYTIDYSSLDAWTKTSSVKVDFYDSGAIKAINASADDRTAEIATKTISAIGKIAKFAAIAGPSVASVCSTEVTTALTDVSLQKQDITRLTQSLEQETMALQAFTARITRSGTAIAPDAVTTYDQLIANVVARQMEVDIAKKKLEKTMKTLSHSAEMTFPERSDQWESSAPLQLPAEVVAKWVNKSALGSTEDLQNNAIKSLAASKSVWLALAASADWQKGTDFEGNGRQVRRAGVRYRIGVPGVLKFCTGQPCNSDLAKPEEVNPVPVTILQRGTTFYLPFASAPFTNASLVATFSEAGVLTSAGYDQKRAPGEAAAGVADSLADQVVAVGTAMREAKTTKLEELKEQVELAKLQKELNDTQKALLESPNSATELGTAALAADTAQKQAEVANIEAEIAVRNARAKLAGASGGQ